MVKLLVCSIQSTAPNKPALADAIDAINRRNGHDTVKVAIQGTAHKNWGLKQEHISQQYTTNLLEVIKVKG